ncbi:MAG: RluA family pseudouridine synthase [Planctomycetes bacterium]|nr:RluA family pseudouridine synthase [Planctomycetota bacterium]
MDPDQEDDRPLPPEVDAEGALRATVPAEEHGSRVDRWLGRLLAPHYSRSYLSALIDEGTIKVDGAPVKPSFRVEPGMWVEGPLGTPADTLPHAEDMELTILHEDDDLIVVDKPVGVIIHPGSGQTSGTLVNGLLARYPELSVVGRADRPGIVHRLDRETSGALLVARTNEAAKRLVNQFKAKTVRKQYCAIVWGVMPFDSDWIELPIGPHPKKAQLRSVARGDDGQAASTFYEVQRRFAVASQVAAFPRTGRTHQIRVHLDHVGFPIIGDGSYGRQAQVAYERWVDRRRAAGERVPIIHRHALHAHKITIDHPRTGEQVTYQSPLPHDMVDLLEVLALDDPT